MVFNVVKLVQVMENYKGFSLSEFVLKIKRTTEAYKYESLLGSFL